MIWTPLALTLVASLQAPRFDDARQIHWQRSLEDALLLVRETQRPLLVAINADGESGSERIVRERYRAPQFVASTRPFVCVVGSVFRHNPRDYDASGARLPCPRLGEVTCGEHIALEPLLHERFLLGERIELEGELVERISPRHALVLPDATKAWDFTLLFDLGTLDSALLDAGRGLEPLDAATFRDPAFDVRLRARLRNEQSFVELVARQHQQLSQHAPTLAVDGLADALRRDLARVDFGAHATGALGEDELATRLFDLAATAGELAQTAWALRDACADPSAPERAAELLPALAVLAWDDIGQRTFLESYGVLADRDLARAARAAIARADRRAGTLEALGEPFDVLEVAAARAVEGVEPVRTEKPKAELPPVEELERALEHADLAAAGDRSDPQRQLVLGRALLLLARRLLQDGGRRVDLMLEDAKLALAAASAAYPGDVQLLLDRARVANYLFDFEDQQRLAERALAVGGADLRSREPLNDDMTEAARWLGDACARSLAARAGGEVESAMRGMLSGAMALTKAAFGPEHDANDWLSLASFYGALGRTRERVELGYAGLMQYPGNAALRSEFLNACWSIGRPELFAERSEALAARSPEIAECAWYAGYARVLEAEWARRGEDPDRAVELYARAEGHFRRALTLEPSYRESSEHYLGMCALGRGFAHLLAERRAQAADALVDAVAVRPQALLVRDGLDREGLDLIDGALEWRSSGASSVGALELLDRLEAAHPGEALYARAISDGELREALRAFGRSDDAAGLAYLERAILAGRRACARVDDERNRRALAQAATILAEHELEHGGDLARIAGALAEAAPLVGYAAELPRVEHASLEELKALARELRARLGLARPVLRAGR